MSKVRRGKLVRHTDGRVGVIYHDALMKGADKIEVHFEQTPGKYDFSDKGSFVLVNKMKMIGFYN